MEHYENHTYRDPFSPPNPQEMARSVMNMLHDSVLEAFPLTDHVDALPLPCSPRVRVLFIESSPYDLGLNEELSGSDQNGIEICRAADVADACTHLVRGGIDVVLLDLSRSTGRDHEQVRLLKQAGADVRVVAMLSEGHERAAAQYAGCDVSVIKTFMTINVLDRAVRSSLALAKIG
jgi:hypothetical protein